jgi:isocitrate dehydrogenase
MSVDSKATPQIYWTEVDEAPALATYSFLPIVQAYCAPEINVDMKNISLAARVLCKFNDRLAPEHQTADHLAELGALALTPEANIIKLPNISASVPQLKAVIAELQAKGYNLPDYVDSPSTPEEKDIAKRYASAKGSAVNPVLREGNSDRRAPPAIKAYARANPHKMGEWKTDSKTRVVSMTEGDFYSSERSVTVPSATTVRFELVSGSETKVLKPEIALEANEVLDASFMSVAALQAYYARTISECKNGALLSLHLKATMMKVSDPIIFGYAVKAFFAQLFTNHGAALTALGANPRNGFADVLKAVAKLPADQKAAAEADIAAAYASGPGLAMVDSSRGITNLHVPSDVIIDASMPAMIRDGGKMWTKDNTLCDTVAMIPDRSYACIYDAIVTDCRVNGALDVKTMGTSPNVGLMAKKAEEYGSHPNTFEIPADGTMRVVDNKTGACLIEHKVSTGDIWRACQTKDAPIRDWISLAVRRSRLSNTPVVFWLDSKRGHDSELIKKVNAYLPQENTEGLEISTRDPVNAMNYTLQRIRQGGDTISATGNVLRDYLTDLFPILEVGTSAKMLSIVPLMNGGGLFETGAGGSAPKHVQQFNQQGYLRWDSLGEFMALAASLEHIANSFSHASARVLSAALDVANTKFCLENKSPTRRLGGIDNRGSHFYLALFWAEALAAQTDDASLAAKFGPVYQALRDNEAKINAELIAAQGSAVDVGGYYKPDASLASVAMRPSATLNGIIDGLTTRR